MQRARVRSLVGELRLPMLCIVAERLSRRKKKLSLTIGDNQIGVYSDLVADSKVLFLSAKQSA